MTKSEKLNCFDHVVVLMMENRSFDNILGYLSDQVDGVIGKNLSNPAPTRSDGKPVDGADQGPVFVSKGEVMDNPNPDPGEYFPHVNTQLFNCVAPASNAFQDSYKKMSAPYNYPTSEQSASVDTQVAPMTGFVQDYYNNFVATQGKDPTRGEYSVIMECFPPEKVPVMSGLANNFAVFDQWHCAVPSQTFCNRSFFHAGTSNGQVVNAPFYKWLTYNHDTLFNRLHEKGIDWVIYFDEADAVPMTLLIHFRKLFPFVAELDKHFRHMDRFYQDAKNGNLPAYAFIEPRLLLNHNDQHPPIQVLGVTQPSTITAGEELINDVYNAVRTSDSKTGSNSTNTLLTITYDEHGGCYDHVSPGPAVPPSSKTGEMDFTFDRLGVRVPCVMISAWIDANSVINTPMQHTSMLKTLSMKWGFESLTARDASAPDFLDVFNRDTPRPGSEWPTFAPIANTPYSESIDNQQHPLNDLQKALVFTANELFDGQHREELKDDMNVGEAIMLMKRVWSKRPK